MKSELDSIGVKTAFIWQLPSVLQNEGFLSENGVNELI